MPYPDEEIPSGYEEDVSSIRDGFSVWVKTDPEFTLRRHIVDVKGAYAAFREAPARKHSTSRQECHFNNDVPNRLTEQKRLSVYNWNPGLRRGKEGAIEKHIAVKWRINTLQEAIEYREHELLTNRFHVTHYGGCAILFNKVTFFSDIKVTSIYLHVLRSCQQDKVKEGESGWVLQGVISRASLRRQPRGGKSSFTVMSLHINNNYAKKRGIGKKLLLTIRALMLEEHVDLVAGDFSGAAWRRLCGNGRLSIIEEAFADTNLPMPPTDVCGFLKPPDSSERWKVRQHGAFSIPHDTLGLRPKDQSCHHEVWLHLSSVNEHGNYEPRAPYQPSKEGGNAGVNEGDRSLSSQSSLRAARLP